MEDAQYKKNLQEKGVGHRGRLREKYLTSGIQGFSDAEVIELLLSFGTPRSDCKEQARNLLSEFGDFAKVLEATPLALQKVKGVGTKNSFAISFIHAVAARYLKVRLVGKRYLHSSQEVIEYLTYQLRGLKKEVLTMVFLDSSHAIITSEVVAEGTLNVNTIYPRELIGKALQYHAAALIIAHNHPSGELTPSIQDIKLTRLLYLLCSTMQIQLLDHIIIGDGAYSFADHGLIDDAKKKCHTTMQSLQDCA